MIGDLINRWFVKIADALHRKAAFVERRWHRHMHDATQRRAAGNRYGCVAQPHIGCLAGKRVARYFIDICHAIGSPAILARHTFSRKIKIGACRIGVTEHRGRDMDVRNIADRGHVGQGNGGAANDGRAAPASTYIGHRGDSQKNESRAEDRQKQSVREDFMHSSPAGCPS